jgi:hypothetical protein
MMEIRCVVMGLRLGVAMSMSLPGGRFCYENIYFYSTLQIYVLAASDALSTVLTSIDRTTCEDHASHR